VKKLLVLLLLVTATSAQAMVLAVLPYQRRDCYYPRPEIEIAIAFLEDSLQKRHLTLVERWRLDLVLKEQQLGTSGLVDFQTAARIGRLVGASHVLLISLWQDDSYRSRYLRSREMTVRRDSAFYIMAAGCVDTSSGEKVWAETTGGSGVVYSIQGRRWGRENTASRIIQLLQTYNFLRSDGLSPEAKAIFQAAKHMVAKFPYGYSYNQGQPIPVVGEEIIMLKLAGTARPNQVFLLLRQGIEVGQVKVIKIMPDGYAKTKLIWGDPEAAVQAEYAKPLN